MLKRSWVRIPAPYTGWTFFTFNCCENCNVLFEKTKINEKEAGYGPLKKYFKTAAPNARFFLSTLNGKSLCVPSILLCLLSQPFVFNFTFVQV